MTQDASAIDRSAVAALTPVVHPTPQGGRAGRLKRSSMFCPEPKNTGILWGNSWPTEHLRKPPSNGDSNMKFGIYVTSLNHQKWVLTINIGIP
jgi:hypothetical protein